MPPRRWRFGWVYTLVLAPIVLTFVGLGVLIDEVELREAALVAPIALGICAFIGFAFSVAWLFTTAQTRYVVADGRLECWRGDRCIRSVGVEDVEAFRLVHRMDVLAILTSVPPPSWPHAMVRLRDVTPGKSSRTEAWPALMIWGSRDVAENEAELRAALAEEIGPS